MNKIIHKNGETAVRGRIGNENGSLQEKRDERGKKYREEKRREKRDGRKGRTKVREEK